MASYKASYKRRRKKPRFYWAEIGFLLLGLIGLRPSLITELLPTTSSRPTTSLTPTSAAPTSYEFQGMPIGYAPPFAVQSQPASTFPPPWPAYTHTAAYAPPQGYPSSYGVTYSEPPLTIASQTSAASTSGNPRAAWPDARTHQFVHHGGVAPTAPPVVPSTPASYPAGYSSGSPGGYPSTYLGRY